MKHSLMALALTLAWAACVRAQTNVSTPQPVQAAVGDGIVQKASNSSSGSVASLAKAYASNVSAGDSLIVLCGVGNGTAPTISDTLSNTYKQAVDVANGTAFNVGIFYTTATPAGADTVTCTNGGTTASMAMEVYEVFGLIQPTTTYVQQILDQTASNTSAAATTSPAVTVSPISPNEFSFVAFGLGTAAQTITVAAPYNNDSGQLNPTTPAGLFSFVAASSLLSSILSSSPSATVGTGEPWAVAMATFKPASLSVQGILVGGIADPCRDPSLTRSTTNINQTAGAQVITGTGSKQTYVCSAFYITATAQNIALVEGTGTVCATGIAGMAGGTTAATGQNWAANGGFVSPPTGFWVFKTTTAGDNVCLLQSGTGQVSGNLTWVQK